MLMCCYLQRTHRQQQQPLRVLQRLQQNIFPSRIQGDGFGCLLLQAQEAALTHFRWSWIQAEMLVQFLCQLLQLVSQHQPK